MIAFIQIPRKNLGGQRTPRKDRPEWGGSVPETANFDRSGRERTSLGAKVSVDTRTAEQSNCLLPVRCRSTRPPVNPFACSPCNTAVGNGKPGQGLPGAMLPVSARVVARCGWARIDLICSAWFLWFCIAVMLIITALITKGLCE